MSIAILCSGLDDTLRGYETHQRLLFKKLRESLPSENILLFKRQGKRCDNEIPLYSPNKNSILCRLLATIAEDVPYWKSFFFSVYFIFYIILFRCKIKKCLVIEPSVSMVLHRFKKYLNLNIEIIYTHGIADDPEFYFWYTDKVIEVNIDNYNKAKRYKHFTNSSHEIFLIPHFYEKTKINENNCLYNFRKRYSLEDKKIAICVGVINHSIKRTDYIVKEFLKISDEWVLILCGEIIDQWIIEDGLELLGNRMMHMVLSNKDMTYLYRNADLLLFSSTNEGFGYCLIEAFFHGVPVLVHDNLRNRWITKDPDQCVNMLTVGALSEKVNNVTNDSQWFIKKRNINKKHYHSFYEWTSVKNEYLKLLGFKCEDT